MLRTTFLPFRYHRHILTHQESLHHFFNGSTSSRHLHCLLLLFFFSFLFFFTIVIPKRPITIIIFPISPFLSIFCCISYKSAKIRCFVYTSYHTYKHLKPLFPLFSPSRFPSFARRTCAQTQVPVNYHSKKKTAHLVTDFFPIYRTTFKYISLFISLFLALLYKR